MTKSNIVLYGFMFTGKSSVARRISEKHGLELVDTDLMIVDLEGATIEEVLQARGEVAFRGLERDLVREASEKEGAVIATGAGVPSDARNLELLGKNGVGIVLLAPPATILTRMREAATERPLLKGIAELARIQSMMADRREAYGRIAKRIDTHGLPLDVVERKVWDLFTQARGNAPLARPAR